MFNNNNGYSLADIAAATGNGNNNGGFGSFGGDGAWVLLLFIIILMGGWNNNNGWGSNGGNGGGGAMPYIFNTTSEVQHGFDQQAIMSDLGDINGAIAGGFAGVNSALCSGFAGVANGFAQAEIAENGRQFANMNQLFGLQTGLSNQLNTIAMNQQQCLDTIGTCAA